jgi:uncharacterized membrane protein
MAVESNRMMGAIGASLIVVSSVSSLLFLPRLFDLYSTSASAVDPFASVLGLAGLAGIVLFMVAMRGFASDYKEAGIFNNALYGLLASIAVAAVAGVLMVAVIFMNFSSLIPTLNPVPGQIDLQSFLSYIVPVLPFFSVTGVVQALFTKRAFNLLAVKSEVRLFRTAGLALVASSVLMVVLVCIGVSLFFAASIPATAVLAVPFAGTTISYLTWMLAAKAFFSIKEPTSQPLPTSPAAGQARYCPHCGAENLPDAVFCTRCGKKL